MTKPTGKIAVAKPAAVHEVRKSGSGRFVATKSASAEVMPAGFLARTRLKKAGGSLVMTVPASARNLLRLSEGQEMTVSIEGSRVILEPMPTTRPMPIRQPKYTLDELLTDVRSAVPMSDEERAWHDAKPAGRETW